MVTRLHLMTFLMLSGSTMVMAQTQLQPQTQVPAPEKQPDSPKPKPADCKPQDYLCVVINKKSGPFTPHAGIAAAARRDNLGPDKYDLNKKLNAHIDRNKGVM
ncbi:hypothetical protein [Rhizobium mayense]|uniref:Uncharacterized protein n=1 Tax=Rhizobium mayense TaxID=1312184 RepID=A0ABT7JTI4_9HYPH|nr:hypothetical protein [Rhizobium mayense]MDL2399654.1 hypothetical protein [Rhizobium mayense]